MLGDTERFLSATDKVQLMTERFPSATDKAQLMTGWFLSGAESLVEVDERLLAG